MIEKPKAQLPPRIATRACPIFLHSSNRQSTSTILFLGLNKEDVQILGLIYEVEMKVLEVEAFGVNGRNVEEVRCW